MYIEVCKQQSYGDKFEILWQGYGVSGKAVERSV